MKAIRVHEFGAPEVLRLDEVPPPTPAENEVLVRVKATGVNPVETYIRSGNYARLPPFPITLGTDAAGVVESVGAGVSRLKPGDRVYVAAISMRTTGTYAEMVVCDQAGVQKLPDRVSFAEGAAIGVPYTTAAHALFERAKVKSGETVFVHGASGGTGIAALQFARAAGATTIGSASSPHGAEMVTAQGAASVNHAAAGYEKHVLELTGGRGVDVIVEMLANVNLVRDLELLAFGGRIVVVGNRGSIEFNPRSTMVKEASIMGMLLWNTTPEGRARLFSRINAGLETGYLRPVVAREIPLAEAAEAHRALATPGAAGKIVLVP